MESTVSIGSCLKDELVSELAESLANYIFPGIVDTSSDDVTDVKTESSVADSMNNGPQLNDVSDSLGPAKGSSKHNDKVEQDALYKRGRRDVDEGDGFLLMPVHVKARRDTLAVEKSYKRTLLNNPFWEFKLDHRNINPRSKIPVHPKHQQIMTGMIHKRWRIPGKYTLIKPYQGQGTLKAPRIHGLQ